MAASSVPPSTPKDPIAEIALLYSLDLKNRENNEDLKRQKTVDIDLSKDAKLPDRHESLIKRMQTIIDTIAFDNSLSVKSIVEDALRARDPDSLRVLDAFYMFSKNVEGRVLTDGHTFWIPSIKGSETLVNMIIESLTETRNIFTLDEVPYFGLTRSSLSDLVLSIIYKIRLMNSKESAGDWFVDYVQPLSIFQTRRTNSEEIDIGFLIRVVLKTLNHETKHYSVELSVSDIENIKSEIEDETRRRRARTPVKPEDEEGAFGKDSVVNLRELGAYGNFTSADTANVGQIKLSEMVTDLLWRYCKIKQLSGDQTEIPTRLNAIGWLHRIADERQIHRILTTIDRFKNTTSSHDILKTILQEAVSPTFFTVVLDSIYRARPGLQFSDAAMISLLSDERMVRLTSNLYLLNVLKKSTVSSQKRINSQHEEVAVIMDDFRRRPPRTASYSSDVLTLLDRPLISPSKKRVLSFE